MNECVSQYTAEEDYQKYRYVVIVVGGLVLLKDRITCVPRLKRIEDLKEKGALKDVLLQ